MDNLLTEECVNPGCGNKFEKTRPDRKYCSILCKEETFKKKRRKEFAEFILEYKLNNPCPCGESDPDCLDLHHRESSEKLFGLGDVNRLYPPNKKVLEEIIKCEVMCANCHRKHHAKIRRLSSSVL